jgi:phosphoserine aminotransferase
MRASMTASTPPGRAHNFSAGPAGLPLPALERARAELLDFEGTGMSILEQSHRGKTYEAVHDEALARLRSLLAVPESHEILILQGGAHLQFAMLPLSFLRPGQTADYIVTGSWGEKAVEEARIVGNVKIANQAGDYTTLPNDADLALSPAAETAYVHYTTNETIHGVQFQTPPNVANGPLVADMSSDILSRPIDFTKHAMIYAGAQKNIGPSGIVVVFLDKAFLAKGRTDISKMLRYDIHAKNRSLYNTPPTFSIYLMRNVLAYLDERGGLPTIQAENAQKAALLYGTIDKLPDFYRAPVAKAARSEMNVVFRLPDEALEARFVKEAEAQRLIGLKGHRSVGGIRVSLYNAVSLASVEVLTQFMNEFAAKA